MFVNTILGCRSCKPAVEKHNFVNKSREKTTNLCDRSSTAVKYYKVSSFIFACSKDPLKYMIQLASSTTI